MHADDAAMTMTQLQSILAMPAAMLTKTSPGGAGSRASPVHPALSQGMAVLHSSGLVCPPPRGMATDRLPPGRTMPLLLQMVTSDAAHRGVAQNSMPPSVGDRLHETMSDIRRYPPLVTVSTVESRERDASLTTHLRERDASRLKSSPHHRSEFPRHLVAKQPDGNVDLRYANNSLTSPDARLVTRPESSSSLSPPPALQPATNTNDASPRFDSLRVGMLERQVSASMPTLLPAVSLPGGDGTDDDKENEEDDSVDPDERVCLFC